MKIRIKAPYTGAESSGIYGKDAKEIPIGTELDVKEEPVGWAGRYDIISGGDTKAKEKTAITNPDLDRDDLKKQADELGLTYPGNISNAKLKELIDAKLAEAPAGQQTV